ncbi:hypothetical protein MTF65_06255 [Streptomyces sp. APSN-46.1]|uniref:hypothetical protein n=1 Tax=Streptomyces sp. APSN-46.1 TaxID=2929049 RepID=UPI001FB219BA|nr:hypothetical protein [Streptomyces sp. APSN-46.1]MCJ1676953.1 hypothetical protein [Streptomyces sp. APSN-46.1]
MNQERREQAQRFLHPDERLIAACAYELGPGVPHPPEALLAPPESSELSRRIEAKLPRALRQLVKARVLDPRQSRPAGAANAIDRAPDMVDDLGTRLMHGTSMEGGWQSAAGHFLVSRASVRGSVTGVLAVTDRRWFGLSDVSPLWQTTPVMKQYWETPRAAIGALRANPTGLLQKGRMEIQFADGSWVAVLASVPAQAAPFAAAAARLR